jgi:hypothetical protein
MKLASIIGFLFGTHNTPTPKAGVLTLVTGKLIMTTDREPRGFSLSQIRHFQDLQPVPRFTRVGEPNRFLRGGRYFCPRSADQKRKGPEQFCAGPKRSKKRRRRTLNEFSSCANAECLGLITIKKNADLPPKGVAGL